MSEPYINRQDQSVADFRVPGDGEEDGPGLGSTRKSPSGMNVQKHSVALKLRDQGNSPTSSLAASGNASRERLHTGGTVGGNQASTSGRQSSRQ